MLQYGVFLWKHFTSNIEIGLIMVRCVNCPKLEKLQRWQLLNCAWKTAKVELWKTIWKRTPAWLCLFFIFYCNEKKEPNTPQRLTGLLQSCQRSSFYQLAQHVQIFPILATSPGHIQPQMLSVWFALCWSDLLLPPHTSHPICLWPILIGTNSEHNASFLLHRSCCVWDFLPELLHCEFLKNVLSGLPRSVTSLPSELCKKATVMKRGWGGTLAQESSMLCQHSDHFYLASCLGGQMGQKDKARQARWKVHSANLASAMGGGFFF